MQHLFPDPSRALSRVTNAFASRAQQRYPDAYGLRGSNLFRLALGVMAISFLSAFFHRQWMSLAAVFVAVAGLTALFGRKAYVDNRHVFITQPDWAKAAFAIRMIYTPTAIVIWFLSSLGFWFDSKIDEGIQWTESRIMGKIEEQLHYVQLEVEVPRSDWDPVRWIFGHARRKVLRTYRSEVLIPASIGVRFLYSCGYAILRLIQYVSFASLAYTFVRSLVFVVSRSLLYAGGTLRFRLPHDRELAAVSARGPSA